MKKKMTLVESLNQTRFADRYFLPLASVSWFSVRDVLISVWLYKDNRSLVVETSAVTPKLRDAAWYVTDRGTYITHLPIRKEFWEDIPKFLHGNYTQVSDRAREAIIDLSGLQYNVLLPSNQIEHNALLIALDPSGKMRPFREALARKLTEEVYGEDGGEALDPQGELMTAMLDRETVYYNHKCPWE